MEYKPEINREIQANILAGLDELATYNGVSIRQLTTTAPYSICLSQVTSQKIMWELKKMVDMGLVVRSDLGNPVKYMLTQQYNELKKGSKASPFSSLEETDETICERILATKTRKKYKFDW